MRVWGIRVWGITALAGFVAGVVVGVLAGLLRRRPVPEVTSYLPPTPALGPTAVGPHAAVVTAVTQR